MVPGGSKTEFVTITYENVQREKGLQINQHGNDAIILSSVHQGLHVYSKDLTEKLVIISYRLTCCCKIKPCCEVICSKLKFLPQEQILALVCARRFLLLIPGEPRFQAGLRSSILLCLLSMKICHKPRSGNKTTFKNGHA